MRFAAPRLRMRDDRRVAVAVVFLFLLPFPFVTDVAALGLAPTDAAATTAELLGLESLSVS